MMWQDKLSSSLVEPCTLFSCPCNLESKLLFSCKITFLHFNRPPSSGRDDIKGVRVEDAGTEFMKISVELIRRNIKVNLNRAEFILGLNIAFIVKLREANLLRT